MYAYVIVSYDLIDEKGYGDYVAGVMPLLQKYGAEVLVAGPPSETPEGPARTRHVVLRFPDEEAARGFYTDPGYVPVRQLRWNATQNGSLVIVNGFEPPQG
jgi:uncharacterized protein (DUF1330 family)